MAEIHDITMQLALPGDGWWVVKFIVQGQPPVTCRTDAGYPLTDAFLDWIEALAANELPKEIFLDEEPEEVRVNLIPTDSPSIMRLLILRDYLQGNPPSVLVDVLVRARDYAKQIDSALWCVGLRCAWSKSAGDWLA